MIKNLMGVVFIMSMAAGTICGQNGPYDSSLDGKKQIEQAVKKAGIENKHVILMIGGNW